MMGWLRRLPQNLSTLRPAGQVRLNWLFWGFGVLLFYDGAPEGHFDRAGVRIMLGPLGVWFGIEDTD